MSKGLAVQAETAVAEGEPQTEPEIAEEPQEDAGETEAAESSDQAEMAEGEQASDDDEVVVSIGEEAPPPKEEPAPAWVKELRKSHRELQRRNRELESRLSAQQQPAAPQVPAAGKKPTLEDHDYDPEQFEKALADWFERKRKADEAEAHARAAQEAQAKEWKGRLENYAKAKASLRVSDFEEAEAFVTETFSVTQQGVLVQGSENPELVVYALGKNPAKAKELASIKDPIKFAFAAAKLEAQLKVTSRKPAAAPEKSVSGTGRVSGAVDSTLEKLRAEAERTGNYSKVIAYKRTKKASG